MEKTSAPVATIDHHVRERYEKHFGVDQKTRTRKQWINLVRVYGMKTVCEKEGMSEEKVREKVETMMQRFNRQSKEKMIEKKQSEE